MVKNTHTGSPQEEEGSYYLDLKKKELEKIYTHCKFVYGTCKDGSFEACLHYRGYYNLRNEIEEGNNFSH